MEFYRIARIVNTVGIHGELKILVETDFFEERFAKGSDLFILTKDQQLPVKVEKIRQHKGSYIIKLQEFDSINQVEVFKNQWLAIDQARQVELAANEFYHHQIIGLKVQTLEGEELGKIKEILSLGSNDVWVVAAAEPKAKDILLPYIEDVVKEVDIVKGIVTIDLLEGLIADEN